MLCLYVTCTQFGRSAEFDVPEDNSPLILNDLFLELLQFLQFLKLKLKLDIISVDPFGFLLLYQFDDSLDPQKWSVPTESVLIRVHFEIGAEFANVLHHSRRHLDDHLRAEGRDVPLLVVGKVMLKGWHKLVVIRD